MKKIILLLTTIVLTACSSKAVNELKQNEQIWQSAKITRYSFELNLSCFCAFSDEMPLKIEVQNGEIVSMISASGAAVQPSDPSYETFFTYGTIERLFPRLEAGFNGQADEITVTYDPTYGYPTQIFFDFIQDAVDDELTVEVLNFQVLK